MISFRADKPMFHTAFFCGSAILASVLACSTEGVETGTEKGPSPENNTIIGKQLAGGDTFSLDGSRYQHKAISEGVPAQEVDFLELFEDEFEQQHAAHATTRDDAENKQVTDIDNLAFFGDDPVHFRKDAVGWTVSAEGMAFLLDQRYLDTEHYLVESKFRIITYNGGFGIMVNSRSIRPEPSSWPLGISVMWDFGKSKILIGKFFPTDEDITARISDDSNAMKEEQEVTVHVDREKVDVYLDCLATTMDELSSCRKSETLSLTDFRARKGTWGFRIWNGAEIALQRMRLHPLPTEEKNSSSYKAVVVSASRFIVDAFEDEQIEIKKSADFFEKSLPSYEVTKLFGADARKSNVRHTLTQGRLGDDVQDTLLVYVGAHGMQDEDKLIKYLKMADTLDKEAKGTSLLSYEVAMFARWTSRASKKILVLDVCKGEDPLQVSEEEKIDGLVDDTMVVITPGSTKDNLSYYNLESGKTYLSEALVQAMNEARQQGRALGWIVDTANEIMASSMPSSLKEENGGDLIKVYGPGPSRPGAEAAWRSWQIFPPDKNKIDDYIENGWNVLTRSEENIMASFSEEDDGGKPIVYVSSKEVPATVEKRLAEVVGAGATRIDVRTLPEDPSGIVQAEHGLLYLPEPYVVPGGMFQEMYGWDSYFILLGLLESGRVDLARGMVNNFLYEIEHYGKILNANRSYYLSRSQPPFLTQMVLEVYRQTKDRKWLERAVPLLKKYYAYWAPCNGSTPKHHVEETGLARYYDLGTGPAPEVLPAPADTEEGHYAKVLRAFREGKGKYWGYPVEDYYDSKADALTPAFYVGDRSMRESGYDPSNRFGRFSADITNYNPVCLNTLLYVMENDLASISETVGDNGQAAEWKQRAAERRQRAMTYLWDDELGLFMDYNFRDKKRSDYPFVTTFFPLWAGMATPEQARRIVEDNLWLFETPGGLQTSPFETGSQWDSPHVWAPTQLLGVLGMRKYGYDKEADRLSINYLSMILENYWRSGTIVEKYNGKARSSRVSLAYGYTSQESERNGGFGWTNAAYLVLQNDLVPEQRREISRHVNNPLPVPGIEEKRMNARIARLLSVM